MIWLKSISVGLGAVVIFAVVIGFVIPMLITTRHGGGMTALMIVPNRLSTWLIPIAVFLLGFGWELWRLGR